MTPKKSIFNGIWDQMKCVILLSPKNALIVLQIWFSMQLIDKFCRSLAPIKQNLPWKQSRFIIRASHLKVHFMQIFWNYASFEWAIILSHKIKHASISRHIFAFYVDLSKYYFISSYSKTFFCIHFLFLSLNVWLWKLMQFLGGVF